MEYRKAKAHRDYAFAERDFALKHRIGHMIYVDGESISASGPAERAELARRAERTFSETQRAGARAERRISECEARLRDAQDALAALRRTRRLLFWDRVLQPIRGRRTR